jgi:DNA gyrase subunit B
MEHKTHENEEIRNMFTALGVEIGTAEDSKALDISNLRYNKIVIMCDADVDGFHITTLILTFFFRYMKDLVEKGNIYIAQPPLYLVKKGKEQQYCWNDIQREQATLALRQRRQHGQCSSTALQRSRRDELRAALGRPL